VTWPDSRRLAGGGVFTAVFPSLVAQVLFIKGNELIGSNRAGIFINLVPDLRHAAERDDPGRDAASVPRGGAGAGAGRDLAVGAGEEKQIGAGYQKQGDWSGTQIGTKFIGRLAIC
jgi:hypothetical protein